MKINGTDPTTLSSIETLVLPRGDTALVFQARGLKNLDEFDKLCPEPVPPTRITREGPEADLKNPDYVSVMNEWQHRRLSYIIVASLEPSKIEWDTVQMDSPGSWANWETDMQNANVSQVEVNLIRRVVFQANALDEEKLKKAREVFLQGLQAA